MQVQANASSITIYIFHKLQGRKSIPVKKKKKIFLKDRCIYKYMESICRKVDMFSEKLPQHLEQILSHYLMNAGKPHCESPSMYFKKQSQTGIFTEVQMGYNI